VLRLSTQPDSIAALSALFSFMQENEAADRTNRQLRLSTSPSSGRASLCDGPLDPLIIIAPI
jgi:hypothetical protein